MFRRLIERAGYAGSAPDTCTTSLISNLLKNTAFVLSRMSTTESHLEMKTRTLALGSPLLTCSHPFPSATKPPSWAKTRHTYAPVLSVSDRRSLWKITLIFLFPEIRHATSNCWTLAMSRGVLPPNRVRRFDWPNFHSLFFSSHN